MKLLEWEPVELIQPGGQGVHEPVAGLRRFQVNDLTGMDRL